MKPVYFKIICGYNEQREVPITKDELEKAYGLFLAKADARAIFENGAVTSKEIQLIVPDMARTLGWNSAYKPSVDDHNDRRYLNAEKAARLIQVKIKERVQFLINANRASEIGKGVAIPELDNRKDTPKICG